MQNGNGHPPALGLATASRVPIIGQPTVKGFCLTLQLVCNCDAHEPLLLIGPIGVAAICPSCKRMHVIRGVKFDPIAGELQFSIQSLPPEVAAATLAKNTEAPPT
jgi:hypothetical protein